MFSNVSTTHQRVSITQPAFTQKGRTINHPGGGGPWSDGPIFFFAEIFSRNEIFWTKAWPYFFFTFYHYALWGEINGWIFYFFKKIGPIFFFRSQCPDRFFFSFSDHPHPWMFNGPPLTDHLRVRFIQAISFQFFF